jgi:hypothetical protein
VIPTNGLGCTNYRSVVLTPDGLMFQSQEGLSLLARNLEVQNVGFPVIDLLTQYPNITSAVNVPAQNHVRFTCMANPITFESRYAESAMWNTGITLVYDYLAKAWTSFNIADPILSSPSSAPATTALVWNNDYVWASGNGFLINDDAGGIYSENHPGLTGSYYDLTNNGVLADGYYVPQTIETQWVATNDIQGFQRCKRVQILGQVYDTCEISLSYAIDYNPSYYSVSFGGTVYPGNNFSVRLHIGNQKCEAIRFKITDTTAPFTTTGQGLNLTRIALTAGVKKGAQKLPPGQSF